MRVLLAFDSERGTRMHILQCGAECCGECANQLKTKQSSVLMIAFYMKARSFKQTHIATLLQFFVAKLSSHVYSWIHISVNEKMKFVVKNRSAC